MNTPEEIKKAYKKLLKSEKDFCLKNTAQYGAFNNWPITERGIAEIITSRIEGANSCLNFTKHEQLLLAREAEML
jgi:hypothetical protein